MAINWKKYQLKDHSEESLAVQLAECLRRQEVCFHSAESALYLLTNTAGIDSSVKLWANALVHSPRFANPNIFPWTLANATAGYIARQFSIEGPNYTLVSNDLDVNELLEIYHRDKQEISLKSALLVVWNSKPTDQLVVDVRVGYILV